MPHADPHLWSFSESLPHHRVERLLSHVSYEEVIELLVGTVKLAKFSWEPFIADRLKGCHRASFLVRVSGWAYDAFFNSPVGYRAEYARSPEAGEVANRLLLERLEPDLIRFPHVATDVRIELLRKPLRATDAKVWIYEPEVSNHLGEETPEILYKPWQQATEDGVGLHAPVGTELEVKGGWLDGRGNERRDPIKRTRSVELHRVGFS